MTTGHIKQHGIGETDNHTSGTLAELNNLVSDAVLVSQNYIDIADAYLSGQIDLYSDHSNLSSLSWSTAGHIIDTDVNFNNKILSAVGATKYDISSTEFDEEGLVHWNPADHTLDIHTGIGPVIQVGKELLFDVYNNTSATILDGSVVHTNGTAFSGHTSVKHADATDYTSISNHILIATMDIPSGESGLATTQGKIRGLDTSQWSEGDTLWVSTTAGQFTNVKPAFPYYAIEAGQVIVSDAISGVVQSTSIGDASDTLNNFFNGTFRETISFTVTSDGSIISGTLASQETLTEDMTMIFSDGFDLFDAPKIIALTAGSDSVPQMNYVYVTRASKVLEADPSGWPGTEHIKIATVYLRSATSTQANGALKNHNWNDHIQSTNGQGHMSHIAEAIRRKIDASWESGVAATCTVSGTPTSDVLVTTTAGVIMQLHEQTFPAQPYGTSINIVNHFSTPYVEVTNLNTQTSNALGGTLINKSFSFVLWGVQNKTGETCHLMINLPIGTYAKNDVAAAIADATNYSVYSIPTQFKGTGFLIARFTFTLASDGTTWTIENTENLRGKVPNSTAGAGGGGTGVTEYTQLTDTPSTHTANRIPYTNAGATALTDSANFTYDGTNLTVTGGNVIANTPTATSHLTTKGYVDNDVNYLSGAIDAIPVDIGVALSDETTDIVAASGTSVLTMRMPYAMDLTDIRINCNTAPSGSLIYVNIKEEGTSIFQDLSGRISIDSGEKTSTTALSGYVLSDSALADDAEITFFIDQVGSTTAGTGLKAWLIGTRA